MTRFQRLISASTKARQLYPDAFCQPMREGMGEGVVGVERSRCERPVLVANPVRAVVLVLPGHRRAGSDSESSRQKGEIVDLDGGVCCCGRGRHVAGSREPRQSDGKERGYPDRAEKEGNTVALWRLTNREHGSTSQATSVPSIRFKAAARHRRM